MASLVFVVHALTGGGGTVETPAFGIAVASGAVSTISGLVAANRMLREIIEAATPKDSAAGDCDQARAPRT